MDNINNMKMASAIFQKNCIKVEKKFFGLMTKVTYTPSNSDVVGLCLEYDSTNGERVKKLMAESADEMEEDFQNGKCPVTTENGSMQLSLCYSKDHKFAALQLLQYKNFEYRAISDVRFAEGDEAEKVLHPFLK